jgi:hypothetical protein
VREAAEAVINIQQAAVKSRQGAGSLEEVQAAVDAYAQILDSVTGSSGSGSSSSSGGLKPGDEVVVPSMGLVNPLPTTIAKVCVHVCCRMCMLFLTSNSKVCVGLYVSGVRRLL